jgi:hypothetical protein
MINITYIYLVENININNPYIIYIGKTTHLKQRKYTHVKTYGHQIIFTEIDNVFSLDRNEWRPIETMWIQTFMSWGYNIVNIRKEGGSGPSFHNTDVRQKMSESLYKSRYEDIYDINITYSSKYTKVKNQWDRYKIK